MKTTNILKTLSILLMTSIGCMAHGTVSDPVSRVRTIYLDGPASPSTPSAVAAVAKAGPLPYYTWNQISQNIPNYADPAFNTSYATVIPDGKLASGNNTGQGALDFSGLDLVSNDWDWPTTPMTAGVKSITWLATAPHDPSFFKVWITKANYDPKSPLAWGDLEFLGKFDPADYTKNGLNYNMNVNIPQRSGKHVLYVAWQRVDPVGEVFFSVSDLQFAGTNTGGSGGSGDGGETGGGGNSADPVASIANVSAAENQGSVMLNVTLDKPVPAGETASVNYQTTDGSATAPNDFTAANGTLTFAAGESSKTITLAINDDQTHEMAESFYVSLTAATNLTLATASATVNIVDNDTVITTPGTRTKLPVTTKIVAGYWHNWQNASAPAIRLGNVSHKYNVVYISFAEPTSADDGTMAFSPSPDVPGAAQFKADVQALQARGTKVLISLGGANGHVTLGNAAKKTNFVNSMIQIIDEYGFDGFDIDIEGGASLSIDAGDNDYKNPTTTRIVNFIDATRQICNHFGNGFMLTTAPETAYVQGAASVYGGSWGGYIPIIHALRDKLDYVHVQYYNSGTIYGADGGIYAQGSVDFLVALSESLLKGFTMANGQEFIPLREDQVAFGLPSTPSSAPAGGYIPMNDVVSAIKYITTGDKAGSGYTGNYTLLKASGGYTGFRGTMAWSINWDASTDGGTSPQEYVNTISTHYGAATGGGDDGHGGNDTTMMMIAPVSTLEGNVGQTTLTFNVTLAQANTHVTTADYLTVNGTAQSGSDYAPATGTLTFAPGETMKQIAVTVYGDTDVEPDEAFTLVLDNVSSNAHAHVSFAAGTIQNDDADPGLPTVSATGASVIEGDAATKTARVTLSLDVPFNDDVTIDYTTRDDSAQANSDYVTKTGTVTFIAGETEKFIDVTIYGDTAVEVDESFTVDFSNVQNATFSGNNATIQILNDDTAVGGGGGDGDANVSISFKSPNSAWTNGFGGADIVITNNGPALTNWTLEFDAAWGRGGFWNAGSWTVNGNHHTITNPAWGTLGSGQSITVGFTGSGSWTHPTNIKFNGAALDGGDGGGNDDGNGGGDDEVVTPNITVAGATVVEGDNGTKTVTATVSLSEATTQQVAVNYSTRDGGALAGSDYQAAAGTLSFAAGETTKSVTLTINGDEDVEADESFDLILSAAVNGVITTGEAAVTITNDDTEPDGGGDANPNVTITFKAPTSSWSGAFGGADIVIKNNGPAIENWTLKFDAAWNKTGFWNAGSWTVNGGKHTITQPTWGGYKLGAGETITIGFTGSGTWAMPTNAVLTSE